MQHLRTFKPALVWSCAFILCAAVIQALPASASDPGDETVVEAVETPAPDAAPDTTVTENTEGDDEVESDDDHGADEVESAEVTDETDEQTDDADESDESEAKPNHGAAVRVAAHCPIRGRAHGKLMSSVARDKAATPESAQAACDAALAALEAASTDTTVDDGTEEGIDDSTSEDASTHAKKVKPVKPVKARGGKKK